LIRGKAKEGQKDSSFLSIGTDDLEGSLTATRRKGKWGGRCRVKKKKKNRDLSGIRGEQTGGPVKRRDLQK